MPRVKRGVGHLKKRNNLMKRVKGFDLGRKSLIKLAKTADTKAGAHAYRDRRLKKRTMRQIWQVRINAAVRMFDLSYSKFTGMMKTKQVGVNRKVLAEIAEHHPDIFKKIVEFVK